MRERFYTTAQLSARTGLPEREVRALLRTGYVRGQFIAGRWVTDDAGARALEQHCRDRSRREERGA